VAKILAYESTRNPAWNKNLLFVADNVPDPGGDFEGVLDRLRSDFVPPAMQQSQVYLTDFCGPPANPPVPCPAATDSLLQTWSGGAALLTFLGHGAVNRWTHEPLLLNTDIPSLQPGHGLPFVITLNCLDGYWMLPSVFPGFADPRSMAEVAVMALDRGSIASFSPAGLGTTPAEEQIARSMYLAIFRQGSRTLGEISLAGQLTPVGYPAHLTQVSTLFGDPAGTLALKLPARHLSLSPSTQTQGSAVGRQVVHRFTLTNDGDYAERANLTLSGNSWPTELSISGDACIAPTCQTEELPPGAQVSVEVRVTIPPQVANGAQDSVTLKASSLVDSNVQVSAVAVTVAGVKIYLPLISRHKASP
jgi:hypothetical protein